MDKEPAWLIPVIAGIFGLLVALIGLGSAIGGILLTQFLQARNRQRQYVQEGLLARYAEFVGIASTEYQRAEQLDLAAPHVHDQAGYDHLRELDEPRHQHYRDLLRLSWQIQILESNPELCRLLQRLVNEMAFEIHVFCPEVGGQVHYDACMRYRQTRFAYGELIAQLVNLVQETHLRGRPVQPASAPAAQPTPAPAAPVAVH